MKRVTIGDSERQLAEVTPTWLREQIEGRRDAGETVCVRVHIKTTGLDMLLSTPQCAGSGNGGFRKPTRDEQEIFDLWEKRGMDSNDFIVGQLQAFLSKIKHV